jgi:uncharacterized protein YggT (Ycf19 family)
MENELMQQLVFFVINFILILSTLLFYAIFVWVIANWLIMFGILGPMNKGFAFLTQLVMPLLKPFRWVRIGMIDLSPIVAILALDLAMSVMRNALTQLI